MSCYREIKGGPNKDSRHGDGDGSPLVQKDCPEDDLGRCAEGQAHDKLAVVSAPLQERQVVDNEPSVRGVRGHLSAPLWLQVSSERSACTTLTHTDYRVLSDSPG